MFVRSSWAALLVASVAVGACNGGGGGGGGGDDTGDGPASVTGRLQDTSLIPIVPGIGATVTVGGVAAQLNDQGYFSAADVVPGDAVLIDVNVPGYVPTQRVVQVNQGQETFVDVRLLLMAAPVSIDATLGGTVSFGVNGSLVIPAGALEDASGNPFSGTASASVTVIDGSTPAGQAAMPGELVGTPTSFGASAEVPLITFSMIYFNLVDSATQNPLVLTSSLSAAMPLVANNTSSAPATIAFWRYDNGQGRWVQVGTATLDTTVTPPLYRTTLINSGGYWNCDMPQITACVEGVVQSNNGPVSNAQVVANGLTYNGTDDDYTDSDGRFRLRLMASTARLAQAAQITAQYGGYYTETPLVISPTPTQLEADGCLQLEPVAVQAPIARFVLTWGESPFDLDSHFTGPDELNPGSRFHVYYSNPSTAQANLDTDDTSSFGPEIVSLLTYVDGEYVYSIHNYSGETGGPIALSGAKVEAKDFPSPGNSTVFEVQDAQSSITTETDVVWRVVKFNVNGNDISGIDEIMEIVPVTPEVYDP